MLICLKYFLKHFLGNSKYLKDKKILILDSGSLNDTSILKNPPEFHSNRVCAISNGSVNFLKKIGIWDLDLNQIYEDCN